MARQRFPPGPKPFEYVLWDLADAIYQIAETRGPVVAEQLASMALQAIAPTMKGDTQDDPRRA